MTRERAVELLTSKMTGRHKAVSVSQLTVETANVEDTSYSKEAEARFVIQYLEAYGYFGKPLDTFRRLQMTDVNKAIKLFQDVFSIKQTGNLDAKTVGAMEEPRCGCPDVHHKSNANYLRVKAFSVSNLAAWRKRGLRYAVHDYIPGVPKAEQDDIFATGFWNWCKHGNIDVQRVDDKDADILISVGEGPRSNFDGPGGVLAWAYMPDGTDRQLLLRFDIGETWLTKPGGRGYLLSNVFAHEAGHLFGLDHSKSKIALMAPYYNSNIGEPQEDDVERFHSRYEKRSDLLPRPVCNSSLKAKTVIRFTGNVEIHTDGTYEVVDDINEGWQT